MNTYLVIAFGSLLGMLLTIVVMSVYVQQSSKYALGFKDAFIVYTTKHTGPIVAGLIVIAICMFLFPNIYARAEAGTGAGEEVRYNAIMTNVINWLRFYAVGIGVIAQGLGFVIVNKGAKHLKDYEDKISKPE